MPRFTLSRSAVQAEAEKKVALAANVLKRIFGAPREEPPEEKQWTRRHAGMYMWRADGDIVPLNKKPD